MNFDYLIIRYQPLRGGDGIHLSPTLLLFFMHQRRSTYGAFGAFVYVCALRHSRRIISLVVK